MKQETDFLHCLCDCPWHLKWDFCFWDYSWVGGLGGGVQSMELSWVMCISVALTTLIPCTLLWELILTFAPTTALRQRTWDPVRGAEAQWQWVAHSSSGAKREKPEVNRGWWCSWRWVQPRGHRTPLNLLDISFWKLSVLLNRSQKSPSLWMTSGKTKKIICIFPRCFINLYLEFTDIYKYTYGTP